MNATVPKETIKNNILRAIQSLNEDNGSLHSGIVKWMQENCHSSDICMNFKHEIRNSLREMVNEQIITKSHSRYSSNSNQVFQDEKEDHIKNDSFQINYGELRIKKRAVGSVEEALIAADTHYEMIHEIWIESYLKTLDVIKTLKNIGNLRMRQEVKSIRFGPIGYRLSRDASLLKRLMNQNNNDNINNNMLFPQLIELCVEAKGQVTKELIKYINTDIANKRFQILFLGMCISFDWTKEIKLMVTLSDFKSITTWYCLFNCDAIKNLNYSQLEHLQIPDNDYFKADEFALNRFLQCRSLKVCEIDEALRMTENKQKMCQVAAGVVSRLKITFPNIKINIANIH